MRKSKYLLCLLLTLCLCGQVPYTNNVHASTKVGVKKPKMELLKITNGKKIKKVFVYVHRNGLKDIVLDGYSMLGQVPLLKYGRFKNYYLFSVREKGKHNITVKNTKGVKITKNFDIS